MNGRILSGMQPTSNLHLGNYLGALKNWVAMQQDYECFFCVVDLHAVTVNYDWNALAAATREIAASYIAAGVDPDHSFIFPQSGVPAHSELMWLLGCMTPLGWLNRMTQFKEKAGKHRENASLGLYAYPVLMAADILVYDASHVPVGEDQKQHLELARNIAISFNQRFETETFVVPEPVIQGTGTRVMSLRDGTVKMSKSAESDMSRINLTDDADTIAGKIRKAKTDPLPLPATEAECAERPEARNLFNIYAALMEENLDDVIARYAGQSFARFKEDLTGVTVDKIAPITARMRELLDNPAEIDRILARGAEKANTIAAETLKRAHRSMGFWTG